MDEKKYAAFSIPNQPGRREPDRAAKEDTRPVQLSFSFEAPFAEIEYEAQVGAAPVASAQPVAARVVDPIRERFFEMRSLSSDIPFARNDPGLFYRQGRFMEDFTDEYQGNAPFRMYYPCYQYMGYEQLRTFFTWRTRVRSGEFKPIALSYIFLYIYELLSGIGVSEPVEGLYQLMAVWEAYRDRHAALNQYLPGWIRDYHIFYPMPHRFIDFIRENALQRYYLDLLLFDAEADERYAIWTGLSSYDVTKSKFYQEGNEKLLEDCINTVLDELDQFLKGRGHRIEDLLVSGRRDGIPWSPFGQALFYPFQDRPDGQVELIGREVYTVRDQFWVVSRPLLDPERRELVGYLMKKTESCLRKIVKYKYRITANPKTFCNLPLKLRRFQMKLTELDQRIEGAVADFHKNLNRTVVTVDFENLRRIRQEALSTQDKLIVEEEDAPYSPAEAPMPQSAREPESPFDSWAALKDALNDVELKALRLILDGQSDLRAIADQSHIMLEVLADSINEKAADIIGDNIMEFTDAMEIYEEYREKIAEMVGL